MVDLCLFTFKLGKCGLTCECSFSVVPGLLRFCLWEALLLDSRQSHKIQRLWEAPPFSPVWTAHLKSLCIAAVTSSARTCERESSTTYPAMEILRIHIALAQGQDSGLSQTPNPSLHTLIQPELGRLTHPGTTEKGNSQVRPTVPDLQWSQEDSVFVQYTKKCIPCRPLHHLL